MKVYMVTFATDMGPVVVTAPHQEALGELNHIHTMMPADWFVRVATRAWAVLLDVDALNEMTGQTAGVVHVMVPEEPEKPH